MPRAIMYIYLYIYSWLLPPVFPHCSWLSEVSEVSPESSVDFPKAQRSSET